ncbi:MAG: FAD-dependent oxidoreductase [Rhodospirillales bacterium]|nr:MAG: FAD-dependent oxidoreductase [Rhodospirillales bacterium]
MLKTFDYPKFDHRPSADQQSGEVRRHPVIVVGAGPVGLTAAIDLAIKGVAVVLLDDDKTVSVGSRAVCYAKRALEIWDRLGCATPMVDKGVIWKTGKVFRGDREIYRFDLLPEDGHKMPAFVNLQQYYLEEYLVRRAEEVGVEIRWREKVTGVDTAGNHVRLPIETPTGVYALEADWLIAADGARSCIRRALGLDFMGQAFNDRFLIADVVMRADFPPERWFWFDPPFHRRQSTLLHMQADNVWRIDFQLGPDADPDEEKRPERVIPRLKAMLGADTEFELEWVSVYTFQCRRLEKFRHGRVLFAGDAAHQVSPFGARGANSGVQDADNLVWKLKAVLDGTAPEALLDSYDAERVQAARENLLNSTRSTDFITPKSAVSQAFRDAVLDLAENHPFARRLVNSGRLSVPAVYADSPLNTKDEDDFAGTMPPGSPCADAPIARNGRPGWLLSLLGSGFTLLCFGDAPEPLKVGAVAVDLLTAGRDFEDVEGLVAQRYDGRPGTVYLVRPDQHVAARWRAFDEAKVRAAVNRALARRGRRR